MVATKDAPRVISIPLQNLPLGHIPTSCNLPIPNVSGTHLQNNYNDVCRKALPSMVLLITITYSILSAKLKEKKY